MLARVTIYGTYGGMGHVNVLHFQNDTETNTKFSVLGPDVELFWIGAHKGNTQSHMQWNRIHVEDLRGIFTAYDLPVTVQGVLGFTNLYCPFLCAVFKFQCSSSGRASRGRSMQGGYDNSFQILSGLWNTTQQTRLDNVAAALATDWCDPTNPNTDGWRLVVNARSNANDNEAKIVLNIIASSKVGTMNTRKIGRGL